MGGCGQLASHKPPCLRLRCGLGAPETPGSDSGWVPAQRTLCPACESSESHSGAAGGDLDGAVPPPPSPVSPEPRAPTCRASLADVVKFADKPSAPACLLRSRHGSELSCVRRRSGRFAPSASGKGDGNDRGLAPGGSSSYRRWLPLGTGQPCARAPALRFSSLQGWSPAPDIIGWDPGRVEGQGLPQGPLHPEPIRIANPGLDWAPP